MPLKKKPSLSIQSRPPIVAVLGHVDHGKTTLLSAIREIDLGQKEPGGITQHIGAYQIEYHKEKITFIDTPGHAAFAKMRSRGASITDLVVLVVAADDGIKPQTKESLDHIKKANVPFLVAINKVDLPHASVEMVKSQLAENGVLIEGYGGNIVCVEVSAKEKKGIDNLLEMILLMGKMENLEADPNGVFEGVVIDSSLNAKKGPSATVLIKNGTLKLGESIIANKIEGKVKLMKDDRGSLVDQAGPSKPVEVLGFKKTPDVGVKVMKKNKSSFEKYKKLAQKPAETVNDEKSLEDPDSPSLAKIKIILKADTSGTLEAIKANIPSEVEVVDFGIGMVNESDVMLAQQTGSQIIGFNVKISSLVNKLIQTEKINIKSYNIIYKLLEDLEEKVLKLLEPTIDEEVLGEAEVIAEFKIKGSHIAGCKVKKGKIDKKEAIHLIRKGKIIGDAKITSLQKQKEEVLETKTGEEAGMVFRPDLDFKIGDVIISYKINI